MSYLPPVWNFDNGNSSGYYQPPQPPRHFDDRNAVYPTTNAQQYSHPPQQGWTPFDSGTTMVCNFVAPNFVHETPRNEETMSDGIRALLDITRNFKKQSKFDDVFFTRSQDSVAENGVTSGQQHQQMFGPSTGQTSSSTAGNGVAVGAAGAKNNYANAVKSSLKPDSKREPTVIYNRSMTPQQQQQQLMTPMEARKWLDRSGRPTLNAKAMDGGPKINGRSIVNGINLNNLKFVKPARQCPKWDKLKHRLEDPNCPLWHPRERCQYYPRCRLTAEVCGFGHPFCGEQCQCDLDKRSLQLNHLVRKNALDALAQQKPQHNIKSH